MIPKPALTALLGKLVGDLAADASSTAVRTAVFKGLTYLLDNHLAQPLLKELLPQMAEMIHDPSERVRRSFLKLLLTVKARTAHPAPPRSHIAETPVILLLTNQPFDSLFTY